MVRKDQTIVTFFNMSQSEHILASVKKSSATCINMNLVPRISRAQKMDALSSMANIAAYRAVLDGFAHLPRISRACSTSFGALPPAKVTACRRVHAVVSIFESDKTVGRNTPYVLVK